MLGRESLVFNATIQLKTLNEIINWNEKGHKIPSLPLKSTKFGKNYLFFCWPQELSTLPNCIEHASNWPCLGFMLDAGTQKWGNSHLVLISYSIHHQKAYLVQSMKKICRILKFLDRKWPKPQKSPKMLIQGP